MGVAWTIPCPDMIHMTNYKNLTIPRNILGMVMHAQAVIPHCFLSSTWPGNKANLDYTTRLEL